MHTDVTAVMRDPFTSETLMFGKIKRLYFIGIGGAGMSGIAEILHNLGFVISGSDHTPSEVTDHLEKLGVTVHHDHAAGNLDDVDVVVISSAVTESNPEVVEARRRGTPVIKRAEMLGELSRLKFSIGVAGTHGKTTTTSMIGRIMRHAELQPTIIVGGIVSELGMGASLGSGEYLVAEADEYDRSFLKMFPGMAVITNLEPDHLDIYQDLDDLKESFLAYMNRVPFYGSVVLSADDKNLESMRKQIVRPYVTFGFDIEADYRGLDVRMAAERTLFSVYQRGDLLGEIILRVPGRHNVANALAAIAACRELQIEFATIADALLNYSGVSRRFEIVGEANDCLLIDDYAHHPTEIRATLETAQQVYDRRVIVVYQPHLYSRTQDFAADFAATLAVADHVVLSDIYPAREEPIPGVTSELIRNLAHQSGRTDFTCVGTKDKVAPHLKEIVKPGDVIILMGAGTITQIRKEVMQVLEQL